LQQERAIVTDIPGTTRDVLTEKLYVGPLVLNLMDTAGIRESSDEIERMGVERTLACAREADLVLWVLDASCGLNTDDLVVWDRIKDSKNIIGLLNKTDLPSVLDNASLWDKYGIPFFNISARYTQGLDEVKDYILGLFSAGDIDPGDLISAQRHKQAAERAAAHMGLALEAAEAGLPEDLVSIDLTEAVSALGEITGENAGSDLIDRIFSAFCVGK
jgi:tRNA modification GTPase